jgi:pentatricopeptide repeat domain-containing protein 3
MNNLLKSLTATTIKRRSSLCARTACRPASTDTAAENTAAHEKIVIPKRIPRSPTDILNALSKTVGHDFTAPHYKFHDDPYLIPTSNMSKRTFAMAQEAGRKAAKWIKQENSKLFQVRPLFSASRTLV